MEGYKLSPLQKVFWNWDIHYACNYRCSYCFLAGKWDIAAKENRYPGVNKWLEIWDSIYDKYGSCHIHFSGGEPFIYPHFFDLITELVKRHTLEFSTNLSFDVTSFIEKIDSQKVRICASFHPEFSNFNEFLNKVNLLRKYNFSVLIAYVAYPPYLERMKKVKAECDRSGIRLSVQPFRGIFNNRKYPDSYTEYEMNILRDCGQNFHSNKKMLDRGVNVGNGVRLCRMGERYGKIYASADVYRCCTTGAKRIGNLLDDDNFQLLREPAICELDSCLCWKAMIVGKEKEYLIHWS